jgi:hypothetical protein
MSSSLQPPPYSTQTRLINSLAVVESVNVASLLNFSKQYYASHKTIKPPVAIRTCNSASPITLQYVLHLPLERCCCWGNRQAISTHLTIPVVLYQQCSRHTSSFPCYLKGCFILQIESRVYCVRS